MTQQDEQTRDFARTLSQLVRGLTILFWGIPITLIICIKISVKDKYELEPLDFWLPVISTGLLLISLFFISNFRKNEIVWRDAIDRARFFAIINFFLSPFIYWRVKVIDVQVFSVAVGVFFLSGVLFLLMVNRVIQQLSKMLPEHSLREDAHIYGDVSQYFLTFLLAFLIFSYLTAQLGSGMRIINIPVSLDGEIYRAVFLAITVTPVALTITLLWKIREVILTDVFNNACQMASNNIIDNKLQEDQ